MSFLLEDETQETLAEALAFIDTFAQENDEAAAAVESTTTTSSSDNDASSWSDHSSASSSLYVELRIPKAASPYSTNNNNNTHAAAAAAAAASPISSSHTSGTDSSSSTSDEQLKKLRARAANTRAVHRYRKRTKTEIVTLREQVEQLSARLMELRNRSAAASPLASSMPTHQQLTAAAATPSLVATERTKRQASEALNRRLREALVKQRKVSDALESVFKKQTTTPPSLDFVLDMDKLRDEPSTASSTGVSTGTDPTNHAVVVAELYQYLEDTVFAETPAVAALLARNGVDCAFNNTLIKHDAAVGKVFEFLSNTPVAGAREQLSAKLWMILTFPIGAHEAAEDPFANVRMCCSAVGNTGFATNTGMDVSPNTTTGSAIAGQFAMQLDCDLGGLQATAMTAIRTFVEPHRTVLTYTAIVTIPNTTLRFRESAWLILADGPHAGCSIAPTLFQTVYRLHAEPQLTKHSDTVEASRPDASTDSELHDTVLTKKGERMRGFLVMIQNRLLNGLRDLRFDSMLPPCFQIACRA